VRDGVVGFRTSDDRQVLQSPSASIVAPLMLKPASFAARASTDETSWSCISITRPHCRQIRNCAACVWISPSPSS